MVRFPAYAFGVFLLASSVVTGAAPDLLVTRAGARITTAEGWWNIRRPEIVEALARDPRVPKATPRVTWTLTRTQADTLPGGVPVLRKTLVGRGDSATDPPATVEIALVLTLPADAGGPVPVVLDLAPDSAPAWSEALGKGWAVATYQPARKPEDGGAPGTWAWAASRVLDYLETDAAVDARQVALSGHSGSGEAALLAMGDDLRFAAAYVGSSGAGGARPAADQRMALCAPRPLFIDGVEGEAGPVYRLLGNEPAFRRRDSGREPAPDAGAFLAFVSRHLAAAPAAAPQSVVAITIDDLPVHSGLPPNTTRADVARSLLDTLVARREPPTYGFVNAKGAVDDPANHEVLRRWRAAGHPLANHAYTHMDLHTHTAAEFQQDIVANEPILQEYMEGADWHWFRYPYLHEGDSVEKRQGIAAFLKGRGYRVAQVTLDFNDYAYNDPYARCLAKGDPASVEWLKESYRRRASEALTSGREMAKRLFGRDVRHVLLMHIGAFEMVMLPELLDLLDRRGFKRVSLAEAHEDPIYSVVPPGPFPGGITFLSQMRDTKGVPDVDRTEDPFDRLEGLCR